VEHELGYRAESDVEELGRRYGADIETGDSIEIAVHPTTVP
jgi:hypothetical protein